MAGDGEGRHPALGHRAGPPLSRGLPGSPVAGGRPRRDRRADGGTRDRRRGDPSDPKGPVRPGLRPPPRGPARPAVARGRGGTTPAGRAPSWPATITAPSRRCASGTRAWGVQFHVEVEASTIPKWAQVPEYEDALARTGSSAASLGAGRARPISRPWRRRLGRCSRGSWARSSASPFPNDSRRQSPSQRSWHPTSCERRCATGRSATGFSEAGLRTVHLGLFDASGVLRSKRLEPTRAPAGLRGGLELHRRHPVVGARRHRLAPGGRGQPTRRGRCRIGTAVPVRRRRGGLPGGVRATAVRALSPVPAAADGGRWPTRPASAPAPVGSSNASSSSSRTLRLHGIRTERAPRPARHGGEPLLVGPDPRHRGRSTRRGSSTR